MPILDFQDFSYEDTKEQMTDKLNEMRRLLEYGINLGNIGTDNVSTVISSVVTNFNGRNDRISTAITLPTIATDGTAIDHVLNTDGSANISLEWAWTGTTINGFIIYVHQADTNAAYTFGDSPETEQAYVLQSDRRACIIPGVAANKYYTFGVQAYRVVDPDVNANRIITTAIIQPARAEEAPYRPSATVPFAGDVTGTVSGMAGTAIVSATDLLNNVVANERLGAQIVGFKAGSIRYKQDGTQVLANLPRYETGRFGQAVMGEENTTNLLTANQSSVETDLTGIAEAGTGTLVRDATTSWNGSASAKLTGTDTSTIEVYASAVPVAASTVYTFSVYTKSNAAAGRKNRLVVSWWNSVGGLISVSTGTSVDVTSSFSRLTYTITSPVGAVTGNFVLDLVSAQLNESIWWDGAQLEAKAYATSWQIGGTARVAETMVVPVAGNFAKGLATIEFTFIPTSTQVVATRAGRLWQCYIDANNYYEIYIHPDGRPFFNIYSGGTQYNTYNAAAPVMVVGSAYSMMFTIDGTHMRQCVNGVQIGADVDYVEPVGTLPTFTNLGCDQAGANQCNGLLDDTRFSSVARTVASHATAYANNVPLPVDEYTTLKQDFDNTLRQTTRNHASRPQGNFTIADNDTTQDKSRATHIIPSGWTSAQIVFNQAISELPVTGGKITAMDGIFDIDDSILVPSNTALNGQGASTILKSINTALVSSAITNSDQTNGNTNISIGRLSIDGSKTTDYGLINGMVLTKVTNSFVDKNTITSCRSSGIILDGSVNNNVSTNVSATHGIGLVGGIGIDLNNSSTDNTIIGNQCNGNIGLTNIGISTDATSNNNNITGNTCKADYGIYVSGSKFNTLSANSVTQSLIGIMLSAATDNTLSGNTCQLCAGHGIRLYGASNNNITGNTVSENNQLSVSSTYNNIHLSDNSDKNNIQSNICRRGIGAKQPIYGIRIDSADCDGNVVTNNDLITGGATASFSDAGTGTISVAGNRL